MKRFFIGGFGVLAAASALSGPLFGATLAHPGSTARKIAALQSTVAHVSLRPSAAVPADADGFFTLGSIADITGGDAAARARLGAVIVGRAPLADSVRQLTPDDVALKLRQAGLNPSRDAVIEGAPKISVTLASASAATPVPSSASSHLATHSASGSSAAPAAPASPAAAPVLKRGDDVSIVLEEDGLSITTSGVARDPGAVGDTIRVHRTGSATDLTAVVLDERTVQLEL
ncbi:hypothetical protein CCAX7_003550 [Capsulimonas corticalis]|uniref:Flagella basal body P-ring formation protein FlgA SAF domain-containing protein n=1 Tax=Capsulimonas corticalis TaxID=2219043 RepID=A0A402CS94_9BACT|nr:flagella basal body P-ring formation protein FlgA [Capsulimonas corticalis]BDI28304.1 hypothetical protein CCAX7_003550 [Capsulimonas corticalis]